MVFSPIASVSPASVIPPTAHIHLQHSRLTTAKSTNGRNLGILTRCKCFCVYWRLIGQKRHFHFLLWVFEKLTFAGELCVAPFVGELCRICCVTWHLRVGYFHLLAACLASLLQLLRLTHMTVQTASDNIVQSLQRTVENWTPWYRVLLGALNIYSVCCLFILIVYVTLLSGSHIWWQS